MFNKKAFNNLFKLSVIILLFYGCQLIAQTYPINTIHGDTIRTCTGNFYDSGADIGNYAGNENYTTTFHAPSGQRIQFNFINLDLRDEGGDTLKIYDGIDTLSPLLGVYVGTGLSFTVESSDSALTFKFTSDGSLENNGWEAAISCCLIPTTSAITGSGTECVNSSGVGYSVTNTPGSTYEWIISGGTQASGTNTNSITINWGSTAGSASVKVVEDNGCTLGDTVTLNVTLNALPTVSFSGLDTVMQIAASPVTLIGNPVGGTFSGNGITGDQFDPAVAGLGIHEIIYSYTDVNSCVNADTQYVDVRNYDQQAGAIWLTDLNSWCSSDAQYTNIGATADGASPSCWSGGTGNNVWFQFIATTNAVTIEALTGGVNGTMRGQQIALWNKNNDLVKCINPGWNYSGTVYLSIDTLTPGNLYRISVDDRTTHGSFSLCIDENSNFDYLSGAELLSDLDAWCSADAAYTNLYATGDESAGSCWSGGTDHNVWFEFVATTQAVKIDIISGGTNGTMRGQQIALWNETGTNIQCINSGWNYSGILSLNLDTLTIGNTYYISVDDRTTHGTFTICIDDDVDYDFKSGAEVLVNTDNWCSADAAYDNIYATGDESAGSCWSGGTDHNVWFKFLAATGAIQVEVITGGSYGTMRGQQIALWNQSGQQLNCINSNWNYSGALSLMTDTLTAGRIYYISVDDRTTHGTFTICLNDKVGFDFKSGAELLLDMDNWCSTDAQYDNTYATGDESAGSCWSGGTDHNVWFEFIATTGAVQVDVITGGVYGSMRGQQIAIWNEGGQQVNCINSSWNYSGTLSLTIDTLTPSRTYWISVDDRTTHGTFTLCVNNKVGYDFKSGAITLGNLNSWCSTDALYTNTYATGDENPGSCWSGGTDHNVWFKFDAVTTNVKVDIKTGGSYGSMRGQQIAIWNENDDEVACINSGWNYSGTLSLSIDTLDIGSTYYISVDDRTTHGSFTLCIDDDVNYDFKAGAEVLSDLENWCSSNAQYSNTYATTDQNAGSCWSGGTDHNVWFEFIATTGAIQVDVITGGSYGTMRGQQIALWNANEDQLNCVNSGWNYSGVLTLNSDTLTPGNTYWISVDDRTTHGTFTLCIDNSAGYDFKSGALELADIDNWCSNDGEYDNTYATGDENPGSCWSGGTDHNIWFKFTAISGEINISVTTGGSYGNMRGQQIALWNENGDELNCINSGWNYSGILTLSIDTLTSGNTYYISVDDRTTHGSFTLCVNNKVGYDFKGGAEELTDLDNWCSANAVYDNRYATGDESAGSCWTGGTDHNVWFEFEALYDTVTINVRTGGSYGTMRGQQIALWNETGTQIGCVNSSWNYSGILTLQCDTLTMGHNYWISVDDRTTHGTFSLCINNVSGDEYWSIADGNWTTNSTWSKTEGGPPASSYPTAGNVVHIKGYDVTVNSAETCAKLEIDIANDNTSLTIDGDTLEVKGSLSMTNSGVNYDGQVLIQNGGRLKVLEDLDFIRNGGANVYRIQMDDNSSILVNQDFNLQITSGTVNNSELIFNNTSLVSVAGDLNLTYSGGTGIFTQLNNQASLIIQEHIIYNPSSSGVLEIELNNSAELLLGGNFSRISDYGILDCNDASILHFNGSSYLQTLPRNAGAGGDDFTYQNITINNSKATTPQVSLDGAVTINGTLNLLDGEVLTTSSNLLTLSSSSSVTNASSASYINGPVKKVGNTTFAFPVGNNGIYQPLSISAPSNVTDNYTVTYFNNCPHPTYDTTSREATIDNIYGCEYWTLDRGAGSSNVGVTIGWDNPSCCLDNLSNLIVAVWEGVQWTDHGNGGTTGNITTGTITSSSSITANNNAITFGNTLPVVGISDPGGPYCPDDVPTTVTGTPTDANGVFTGTGITDNLDGTGEFDPSLAGPGIHTITYTYTNPVSSCSNAVSATVEVHERPTSSMTGSTSICIGSSTTLSIYFTGTAPFDVTYTDGISSFNVVTSDNPYNFMTSQTGTYTVTGLIDGNGCQGVDFGQSAIITEYTGLSKPTITPGGPTTFCEGNSVDLTSSVSPNFYLWSNGEVTQTINVTESGDYTVQIVDLNSCLSEESDPVTVTVNPLPGKAFIPEGTTSFCQDPVNTTYNTPGASYAVANEYEWTVVPDTAGLLTGNTTSAVMDWNANFVGTAKIIVIGHNSCGYGPVSDTLYISIDSSPDVDLGGDQTVCNPIVLDAGNPGASYIWSDGITTTQTYNVTFTGTYGVTVTNAVGCEGSDQVTITMTSAPTITTQPSSYTRCVGADISLSISVSGPGPYTYQWQKDGLDLSDVGNISGSNTTDLSITNAQTTDSGDYTCIVSGLCGDITSDTAVITILPVPVTGPIYHTNADWAD